MYTHFLKRLFDLIIAFLVLLILSPLLIICVILIKIDSHGPVFFFQDRVGLNGQIFKIFKLRTMTNKVHTNKHEIFSNNAEITRIGGFLRKYKVDELPQLINVLKGDLALIGPRPLLIETNDELGDLALRRQKVRPGLSGWAQVNGNIHISREERIKLDLYYIDHLTFIMDFRILLKTILVIFRGEEKFVRKENG